MKSRRLWAAVSLAAGVVLGGIESAHADVTNPDGQIIPLVDRVGPILNNPPFNEGIDYRHDASVDPQRFAPLCNFEAQYIYKGGASQFAIGWYNVDDNRPSSNPPLYPADITTLFDCNTNVPETVVINPPLIISAGDILQDPQYQGGLIGFALVPCPNSPYPGANQYHYSERRFNTVCTSCPTQEPWISTLVYQSKQKPNAFYLGFEDLNVTPTDYGGNDGDFEDFLFLFTGLTCFGGGQPCTVSNAHGICTPGVTECSGAGGLTCKQVVQPATETCNGLDDDCDGQTDEGDICPTGTICDQGACVQPCGVGEFVCPTGKVCSSDGHCVDPGCENVTCDAGTVCVGGVCKAPCDGVVCPYPQVCRGIGICVDPCAGVTYGAGQVCNGGACVGTCDCVPCAAGQSCDSVSGLCGDGACEGVHCAAGKHCANGMCVDACSGAVCPAGQMCKDGQCVAPQGSTTGSSTGVGFGVGGGSLGTGGAGGMGGAAGGAGGSSSAGGSGGWSLPPRSSCGCRVVGDDARHDELVWAGVAMVVAAARRKRSRR